MLPKENPSIQKFHSTREAGVRMDTGAFASEAATVAWLEKAAREPQFLEQLQKLVAHHPVLAGAAKLAPRIFLTSVARALREGSIWYEAEAKAKGGGGASGGGGGGGGGGASSNATPASGAGAGGAKPPSKLPKSGASQSLSFDPPVPEPEVPPLETPPAVPGRASDGMTH
jgi:hypothetical protein